MFRINSTPNNRTKEKSIDKMALLLYFILIIFGVVSIFSATYEFDSPMNIFSPSTKSGMQMLWIFSSLFIGFVIFKLDQNFFETYAAIFYLCGIVLLLVTLGVAHEIKGSRSWLVFGPIRLQPAEFMKIGIALALVKMFDSHQFNMNKTRDLFICFAIIFIPTLIVIMQKETGTALIYLAFFFVLFREGMPAYYLLLGFSAILYFILGIKYSDYTMGTFNLGEILDLTLLVFLAFTFLSIYTKFKKVFVYFFGFILLFSLIIAASYLKLFSVDLGIFLLLFIIFLIGLLIITALKYNSKRYLFIVLFIFFSLAFIFSTQYIFNNILQPHQQKRIRVTLRMDKDALGVGYHAEQSKIAIGSGGLTGKGFLNGTQNKLKYVPEPETDFIFSTIGEELGFVGTCLVLLLYLIFILRLIAIAERQTSRCTRVYGYCVASIFLFHFFINIGMVLGITPVIGIPLLLFSYGGSSMWSSSILFFILLKMDKNRIRATS